MEMGRETKKIPYGDSPFPNRVCSNLGTNTYTLRGNDGSVVDFMALTMIDPASGWFKIVELPLVRQLKTITVDGRESLASEEIFDKN